MRRLVFGAILLWSALGTGGASGREHAAAAGTSRAAQRNDLATTLPVLHGTLRLVRDKYVDPTLIVPRELFVGALRQLERDLVPVVVSTDDATGVVVVQAGEHTKSIALSAVQGLWDVAAQLQDVFAFLGSALPNNRAVDLRRWEVAACKGLVESLSGDDAWIEEGHGPHRAGVGVAVSMQDGALTVQRVIAGSAASLAGLEPRDQITQIDGKPVRDLRLDEALEKLRGPAGSRLSMSVRRPGVAGRHGDKQVGVIRELIAFAPVDSRELRPGIGYVRIKYIGRSTVDLLSGALAGFRERGRLDGLVVDLRDNHGGLFSEAAKIADIFLEAGSIALTRGASEGVEEKGARKDGTEPQCPLVILTNSVTASGSELIASALQKNERAVVVGGTSFGISKIQLLFPSVAAKAAIKLTIAEFQAPAGTPIHGVGVVPDIVLSAVGLDRVQPRFFGPSERARARDRLRMFPDAKPASQPEATIWHASLHEPAEAVDVGEPRPRDPESDFALRLAADLATRLPRAPRSAQIDSLRAFVQNIREREMAGIGARLEALGVDWRAPAGPRPDGPRPNDFAVRVTTDRPQNTAVGGEPMTLTVAVTNRSLLPAYRVRAITKSENDDFHDKELLFGYVGPGQTVARRVSFGQCARPLLASLPPTGSSATPRAACRLSMSPASREDIVKVIFHAEGGEAPARAELRPITTAQPKQPSPSSLESPIAVEIAQLRLAYREERIRIEGVAKSRDGIVNVRVFANERKVLYRQASDATSVLPFDSDVSLDPGINVLRVVVSDRNEGTTARTVIVRRDGPRDEPLPRRRARGTPAADDEPRD